MIFDSKKPTTKSLEDLGIKIESDNLTPDQLCRAKQVLGNWSDIFSTSSTDLGRTDTVKHHINLTDDVPFKDPFTRVPTALYEEVRQHLKEMLEAGAIRPLKSPYSSNVVLVRKKDGSLRFCIDFRKLNSRTVKDAYNLPRVDDTINMFTVRNPERDISFPIFIRKEIETRKLERKSKQKIYIISC